MNEKNHVQQIIGNNLRTYRQEMKMTQEELAEKAGLSTPFLANLERGTKGMSIFSLRELSSALGISTDCLLFEDNANGHIKNIEMLLRDKPERIIVAAEKLVRLLVESMEPSGNIEKEN